MNHCNFRFWALRTGTKCLEPGQVKANNHSMVKGTLSHMYIACVCVREREREKKSEIDVWLLINRVKNVSDAPKQCYAYCIEYPDQLYIVTSILQVFHVLENDSAKFCSWWWYCCCSYSWITLGDALSQSMRWCLHVCWFVYLLDIFLRLRVRTYFGFYFGF